MTQKYPRMFGKNTPTALHRIHVTRGQRANSASRMMCEKEICINARGIANFERLVDGDLYDYTFTIVGCERPLERDLYNYVIPEVAVNWRKIGVELLNPSVAKVLDIIEHNYPKVRLHLT